MSQAAPTDAAPAAAPTEAPATTTEAPATTATTATPATDTPATTTEAAPPAAPADDKPWLMRDKFVDEIEQAKAYPEMLKKMGKNWGAPKDDYNVEGIEGIIKDDPLLGHLKPMLKELGLSQDGFNSLIKGYQDANIKLGEKIAEQVQKELVAKDALTVQAVDKWISASFDEAQQKTIRSWIVGVEDFQLLNTLRVMLPQSTSVPSSTGGGVKFESVEEVENEKVKYRTEISQGLRVEDKNYANELQQRWKDAYQRKAQAKKK